MRQFPISLDFDFAGLLAAGLQRLSQQLGEPSAELRCHVLSEPLPERRAPVQPQQRRPGQVDLQDSTLLVQAEVADRGEVEQVMVLVGRLLQRLPGAQQLLVLHFQFNLMYLQFVEQAPAFSGEGVSRVWASTARAFSSARRCRSAKLSG